TGDSRSEGARDVVHCHDVAVPPRRIPQLDARRIRWCRAERWRDRLDDIRDRCHASLFRYRSQTIAMPTALTTRIAYKYACPGRSARPMCERLFASMSNNHIAKPLMSIIGFARIE